MHWQDMDWQRQSLSCEEHELDLYQLTPPLTSYVSILNLTSHLLRLTSHICTEGYGLALVRGDAPNGPMAQPQPMWLLPTAAGACEEEQRGACNDHQPK